MSEYDKRRLRNASGEQNFNGRTEFERRKQRHASGESTMSTDSVSHYIPTPPDGGYGWIIVFASFMNHVIVDGIAFTFGIFYGEFLQYFEVGKGETALVGALLSGFYLLTAPVAGSLVNKFGCRSVSIAGSIIAFTAFTLSAFSTNIKILSLTYGVMGGFGLGLLYLPNIVAVSYYFHRRRALATGVAVCGAGVGCFIFAPAGQWLLEIFHWRQAMLIVAAVTLHGCVFGSLLRSLVPIHRPRKPRVKNLFDRLQEHVKVKNHETSVSENGPVQEEIIQKVQEIKQAREKALLDEEMEIDDESYLNSTHYIDHQNSQQSSKTDKISTTSDSGVPASSIIPDVIIGECNSTKNAISEDELHLHSRDFDLDGKVGNGQTKNVCSEKQNEIREKKTRKKVNLQPNAHVKFAEVNKRSASNDCIALVASRTSGKLPRGIHREDFARPLYRNDIFYSGSVLHIPEFRSQPNVNSYVKSITTIPDMYSPEQENYICHCIPISKAARDTLKQMTDLSLLREPSFFIPCLANLFGAIGLFIPFVYSTDRAISHGVERQQAAFLLSIIGITNTLGRILAGFVADLKHVSPLLLHNLALVAGGLSCILSMFCVDYSLMCFFAAFFGLCIATWISLTSIVLCNLLGLERLTNAFGLLTMTRGVATLVGSPMAGFVFDATQDYNNSFHVGGAMLLLGGFLCCLLHLPVFKTDKEKDLNIDDLDLESLQDVDVECHS